MNRTRWPRGVALGIAAALGLPAALAAQAPHPSPAAILARADAAYSSGDHARARVLYAEALAADSTESRAVFRLAQLEESTTRALALYRRYIALEPDDPWGYMAEADVLGRQGRLNEGLAAYARASALAPSERDVAIGRARLLAGAGRQREAADELTAWTTKHPEDGEAWDLLGRAHMRSRRPRAAAAAFENASQRSVEGADTRLVAARAASAPAITPGVSSAGDSDGNRTTTITGVIDFMVADGTRAGLGVRREVIGTDVEEVQGTSGEARLVTTPSDGVQLTLRGGVTQFGAPSGSPVQPGPPQGGPPFGGAPVKPEAWTVVEVDARLRARKAGNGPSMEVRAEQSPLTYSSLLITNRASRSEARMALELPLAALRLRGMGRFGLLEAAGEPANRRTGFEGALLLPLGGGRVQPSVQYREAGYEHATLAGYFAPRRASTAEAAVYFESGDDGRLSMAADLGAGMQRVTEHAALPGPWTRAWRAWTQVSLALGPSRAWYVEAEAYDAPFGLDGVATAGTWRYLSVSSGVRWALR